MNEKRYEYYYILIFAGNILLRTQMKGKNDEKTSVVHCNSVLQ